MTLLKAEGERPLFTARFYGRGSSSRVFEMVDVFSIDSATREAEISAATPNRKAGRRIVPVESLSSFQVLTEAPPEVICPERGSNDVTEVEEEHYCEACQHYFA